uniref:Uncharacterized protein n=1 Tax=Arion vulgaris TaxID=1028688 RepID=A0A0B7AVD7_9EUPU
MTDVFISVNQSIYISHIDRSSQVASLLHIAFFFASCRTGPSAIPGLINTYLDTSVSVIDL